MKKCDIFTNDPQSELMASFLNKKGSLLEPSVGEGNLLKFINLDNYNDIRIFDIESTYLDKIPDHKNMKKYNEDFLKSKHGRKKYDNIILNPPYIKIQELEKEYVEFIRNQFPLLKKGNIDIYQAFILKCIDLLKKSGKMVAIIPNSLFTNVCSMPLVKYLLENKLIEHIVDYGSEKVFDNISVYVCIVVISKKPKTTFIYNKIVKKYQDIVDYNIFKVKQKKHQKKLGDICQIFNGIATLRDGVFIHKNKLNNEDCWKPYYKVSKNEMKWIIYPYDKNGKLFDEKTFTQNYPKTYQYLSENKDILLNRDKGKGKYKWYEFGRSQGLSIASINQKVLFISTLTNLPLQIYEKDSNLFGSGICIRLTNDNYTLDQIKQCITDNGEYIEQQSSKRDKGWFNLSSRVLKNINC